MNGMQAGQEIDLTVLVPELAVTVTAVLGLLMGSWLPRRRQWLVRVLALVGILVAVVATVVAMTQPPVVTAAGTYTIDIALNAVRLAVLAGTAIVIGLATDQIVGMKRESEFYVLLLLGALGTIVVAGASDLLVLASGYLLASIPLYALVGFAKDRLGTEAMLKYYLMGALFGMLILVGVVLLLATGGSTSYAELGRSLLRGPMGATAIGILVLAAGLLFKAGAVPAHFWVPDAIEGATPAVAAFIATIPKIGALVALFRISTDVFAHVPLNWTLILALLAAVTMTLGNLAAFFQTSVRRLLAYSTISQVGYLLMIVAAYQQPTRALPSLLYYLFGYTITNLGAFAVVSAFASRRTLIDYTGLFRRHRWAALSLTICLLGLVGTPPTAVFVGKLTAFTTAFEANLGWLVILAAANSVASLFYYLRWIFPLFQRGVTDIGQPNTAAVPESVGAHSLRLTIVLGAVSLAIGIAANPLLQLLN
ncbi:MULTISPECIES: NADH-quinone oxidoreductase subunit N [Leifsonia]|uniref:NADH-quinone oxidoreductase subunit N n=1 Tax=Leifsonia virtsii TaxID=3035915 RepID=A0ABT8IXY1_9MICO|nr:MULTISPECIES: NADH-quinone oxidoreductase subunit N [Leifsonia]MDN4597678.1 NADH-quinone oxidoreductase subunit N [Leifsonia virtsii]